MSSSHIRIGSGSKATKTHRREDSAKMERQWKKLGVNLLTGLLARAISTSATHRCNRTVNDYLCMQLDLRFLAELTDIVSAGENGECMIAVHTSARSGRQYFVPYMRCPVTSKLTVFRDRKNGFPIIVPIPRSPKVNDSTGEPFSTIEAVGYVQKIDAVVIGQYDMVRLASVSALKSGRFECLRQRDFDFFHGHDGTLQRRFPMQILENQGVLSHYLNALVFDLRSLQILFRIDFICEIDNFSATEDEIYTSARSEDEEMILSAFSLRNGKRLRHFRVKIPKNTEALYMFGTEAIAATLEVPDRYVMIYPPTDTIFYAANSSIAEEAFYLEKSGKAIVTELNFERSMIFDLRSSGWPSRSLPLQSMTTNAWLSADERYFISATHQAEEMLEIFQFCSTQDGHVCATFAVNLNFVDKVIFCKKNREFFLAKDDGPLLLFSDRAASSLTETAEIEYFAEDDDTP